MLQRRERAETRLARIFVIRNVLTALLMALMIVLIVFVSIPRMRAQVSRGNALPTGDDLQTGDQPVHVVRPKVSQTVIYVSEPDPKSVNPKLKRVVVDKGEFSYACGHVGEFIPSHPSNPAMADPLKYQAQQELRICWKCRELLEYSEKKQEPDQASASSGRTNGGAR
ncbi:MAG: hypothetical protein H7A35_07690 [Planctomycetales bacterium]|nr:MAG: hypothetical protein H7A35_07690 [Planctomycetales bacterium]